MGRTYNRPTTSTQRAPVARCEGCQWNDVDAGALGRAAQHHDRTGHIVIVEQTRVIRYGATPEELRAAAEQPDSLFDTTTAGGPTA